MRINERNYNAKGILDSLRSGIGDSEFGYRMQAVFAHILLRLGACVKEVNAQGHPDIKAKLSDRVLKIQVKTASHGRSAPDFVLSKHDLNGICSKQPETRGYLAILDCAEPVAWLLVDETRLKRLVGQSLHLATFRAECDTTFSEECTNEFLDIIISNRKKLPSLTFRLLAVRALRGSRI